MKKIFLITILAFTLWGCGDTSNAIDDSKDDNSHDEENFDTGTYPISYFITDYCVPSNIEVKNISGVLNLIIKGEVYSTYKGHSTYEKAKEFAEFYGDISYSGFATPGMTESLAYPIDKITLSSVDDFDAEHPAGKPLDDIVKLEYETFYEYIKNGYKLPDGTPRENNKNGWELVRTLYFENINAEVATLVHLDPFVAQLINVTPLIHFASKPKTPGEYTFTLEMTINGEVLKSEFTHTFE